MLYISIAKLLGFFVGLQIIFALRQAEPALRSAANHNGAVLEVLTRREAEKRAYTHALQAFSFRLQVANALDIRDARQLRLDRLRSCRVNRGGVHAAGVIVANLLFVGSRGGFGFGGVLENLAKIFLVLIREPREAAIGRVFRRNRVGLHPPAHGELIEVVAGFASFVEIGGFESPRSGLIRRAGGSAQTDT